MKKLISLAVSIVVASAAHAETAVKPPVGGPLVFQPPVVPVAQGDHCNQGSGPRTLFNYDARDHLMQCGERGTWEYVPESDDDRIVSQLARLNATEESILEKLNELVDAQHGSVASDKRSSSNSPIPEPFDSRAAPSRAGQ